MIKLLLLMSIVNIFIVPAFLPLFDCTKRFIFAHGGRGGSKSVGFSQVLLNRARQKKIRILCCREIQKSIKDSVHTLLKDLIEQYNFVDYEIQNNVIYNKITGSEFIFVGLREHNIQSIKSYANVDICWIEEAHAVTQKSLDILTPTIRKPGSQFFFSYNRTLDLDPVHKLFLKKLQNYKQKVFIDNNNNKYKWLEYNSDDSIGIFINYDGNLFFPNELKKEMEEDKLDNYDLYLHKWLGEPESQAASSVISRTEVLKSVNREVKEWNYYSFGVDPAWKGNNESVLCIRHGFKVLPLLAFTGIDNMKLVAIIIDKAKEIYKSGYKETIFIKIDIGFGAGIIDRLEELKSLENIKPEEDKKFDIEIIGVGFGEVADDPQYKNHGTEMWFNMKDAIKTISLPNDQLLINQLVSRKYKIFSDATKSVRLEKKEDMKEDSPDRGDALALCLDNSYETQYNFDNLKIESGKARSYLDK